MTNEELKKKICEIIAPYVSAWGEDERIADALIAAGIGDIREAEHRVEVYKRALHIAHTAGEFAYYVDKAEKELAEEGER